MKAPAHIVTTTIMALCVSPFAAVAQAPLPIREQTPGLLAQAGITPASARLAAFAEVPGAQIVAASIERLDNRLIYSFDLKYENRNGNEHVEIDAVDGRPICVEYCMELDGVGNVIMAGAPEMVADAQAHYAEARATALASVPNGQVVRSGFRVQQSQWLYLFEIAARDEALVKRVLVNSATGRVVSVEPI
jgi:uncharacterized membrane protein YkoI